MYVFFIIHIIWYNTFIIFSSDDDLKKKDLKETLCDEPIAKVARLYRMSHIFGLIGIPAHARFKGY